MSDVDCPYCGHEFRLCHDDGAHCQDDGREEEHCPGCSKIMMVRTVISYDHYTETAACLNTDDPSDEDHNWGWEYVRGGDDYVKRFRCRNCGIAKEDT